MPDSPRRFRVPVFVLALVVVFGVVALGTSEAATTRAPTPGASITRATAVPNGTNAVTGRRVNWPCAGCITYIPSTYDPTKRSAIVVALHGDEGTPSYIESVWEPTARKYNAILFAPLCPTALGCRFSDGQGGFTNSWWGWLQYSSQYDDGWIARQVNTLGRTYRVAVAKEFLTGWSGGADYLGWYAPAHGEKFAAASFVAGGVPYHPSCPARRQAAHFLMGSKDFRYLSGQPDQVRGVYTSCGNATARVVLPGATHQGTIDALTTQTYADKIMQWFLKHPRKRV